VLVHHASKKHRAQPGQALRGSGDLHAFGDDNAYLTRSDDHLVLTLEHRQAQAPDPIALQLTSRPDGGATHLELLSSTPATSRPAQGLADAVLELLERAQEPLYRTTLRARLRVNNHRLGLVLGQLQRQGRLLRTTDGWQLPAHAPHPPQPQDRS
jgi:hypothetical protein